MKQPFKESRKKGAFIVTKIGLFVATWEASKIDMQVITKKDSVIETALASDKASS